MGIMLTSGAGSLAWLVQGDPLAKKGECAKKCQAEGVIPEKAPIGTSMISTMMGSTMNSRSSRSRQLIHSVGQLTCREFYCSNKGTCSLLRHAMLKHTAAIITAAMRTPSRDWGASLLHSPVLAVQFRLCTTSMSSAILGRNQPHSPPHGLRGAQV